MPLELVVDELVDIAEKFDCSEVIADATMIPAVQSMLERSGLKIIAGRQGSISMSPVMFMVENLASNGDVLIGDDQLAKWCFVNTGQLTTSTGRRPMKVGRDETTNTRKIDVVAAVLTAPQLAQDQINNSGKLSAPTDVVDPWTDPVNAVAVRDGYGYMPVWPTRAGNAHVIVSAAGGF